MNCSHKLQPSEVIIFYSLMQQTILRPPFAAFYPVSVIIDRTIVMACTANTAALAAGRVWYRLAGGCTALLWNLPLPIMFTSYFRKYPKYVTFKLSVLPATDCFLWFIWFSYTELHYKCQTLVFHSQQFTGKLCLIFKIEWDHFILITNKQNTCAFLCSILLIGTCEDSYS